MLVTYTKTVKRVKKLLDNEILPDAIKSNPKMGFFRKKIFF